MAVNCMALDKDLELGILLSRNSIYYRLHSYFLFDKITLSKHLNYRDNKT